MSIVLIVEDEPIEQEFIKSIILDELLPEDKVLTCDSGVEAIKLAKQYHPNLIFMDIFISEMDGLTTIKEIREFLPDACITIMSAHSNFSYAQNAISLRVFDYLLKPVKPGVLKETFQKMLKAASSSFAPTEEKPGEKNLETKEDKQYFIEESIKYIKENFKERLTLEMVASKVFVNPKYLSHVFKKEMGVAFTEYIIDLRIQHACKLLETTNYQAYRISLECGFSDPSYFNRVFCAQMNMTPQTYRKHANASKLTNKKEMTNKEG